MPGQSIGLALSEGRVTLYPQWTEAIYYEPFGTPIAATDVDARYTDHEYDQASAFHYMKGRFQDPGIAKFTRPDPMRDWDWIDPQSVNLYQYVRNEPINLFDPMGKKFYDASTPIPDILSYTHQMIRVAEKYGFTMAADNLRYYLSGKGGTKEIDANWLRSFDRIRYIETSIRGYQYQAAYSHGLGLKEGESTVFTMESSGFITSTRGTPTDYDDLYYSSGGSRIDAIGSFLVSKKDGLLVVEGAIRFKWTDVYDWDAGKFTPVPVNGINIVTDSAMAKLKKVGASDFNLTSIWVDRQKVEIKIQEPWFTNQKNADMKVLIHGDRAIVIGDGYKLHLKKIEKK